MAAEPSTARLTLPSCQQMGRKGRPWVAAEVQCARCERKVTKASGKDPKGELRGWRGLGQRARRPRPAWREHGWRGAAGVETVAQRPRPWPARVSEPGVGWGAWRLLRPPASWALGKRAARVPPSQDRSKTSPVHESPCKN